MMTKLQKERALQNEAAQKLVEIGQEVKWEIQDGKFDHGKIFQKYGKHYLIVYSPRDKNFKQIEAAEAQIEK
jgi:hypothetical protein